MSETRFPPQGTKCVDCGCCQANIYADGDPLCWACDAGAHGPKKLSQPAPTLVVKNSPPREESPVREEIRTPVAIAPAKPVAPIHKEEPRMPKRISDDIRAAIQAAPPRSKEPRPRTEVRSFERHDQRNPPRQDVERQAREDSARKAVSTFSAGRCSAHAHHNRQASGYCADLAIAGQITAAGADKFWSILSLEQKAQIIQASLRSILTAGDAQ